MPPKSHKEVIFFLLGTGPPPPGGELQYFAQSKEVVSLTLQKKIILKTSDEVGIVFGVSGDSEESCIDIYCESTIPLWETVKDLKNLENPSQKQFCDWFTAVSSILTKIEDIEDATGIILILLFDCYPTFPEVNAIDVQAFSERINELDIQLLWIGSKPLLSLPKESLNTSERTLRKLLKKVNGEYRIMSEVLPSLRIYKSPEAKLSGWKCDLEIGEISIPTIMYVQATDEIKKPMLETSCQTLTDNGEQTVPSVAEREYIDKYRDQVDKEETISGYMFAGECVPVPVEYKLAMTYDTGPAKSMKIYGFIENESIALEDLSGNSTRFVVPGSPEWSEAFFSLVQAMAKTNRVAVVRRLYQAKCKPKMGFLFPHVVPGEVWGLTYIELPYFDERRIQTSESLQSVKNQLSEEKYEAVGNFIDSMMLTPASEDEPEPFAPGTVFAPNLQYLFHCLTTRAMNPEHELPHMDGILASVIPLQSKSNNREKMEKILSDLFPIVKVEEPPTEANDTNPEELPVLPLAFNQSQGPTARIHTQEDVDLDALLDEDMGI